MPNEQNKVIPDKFIRRGTIGQVLEGIFNEDISSAEAMWFEYIPYDEDDDMEGIKLMAELSQTDNRKMEYITEGNEFTPGLYKVVCAVKFSDTKILYSNNRQILKVLKRFEAYG